jgi:hypothetical protein
MAIAAGCCVALIRIAIFAACSTDKPVAVSGAGKAMEDGARVTAGVIRVRVKAAAVI